MPFINRERGGEFDDGSWPLLISLSEGVRNMETIPSEEERGSKMNEMSFGPLP